MRRSTTIFTMVASLAIALALALPAAADPSAPTSSGPPGDNGTIKIHSGDTESEPMVQNEPHPGSTFHVHGFFFDPNSTGTWTIVAWPPTGDGTTVVASGSWTANGSGEWRTSAMALPCGHYKAFAHQDGGNPGQKQKVFWIEGCVTAAATPTPAAVSATSTPTPTQLGFQQPPMGAVTPIVENTQGPQGVAGQQQQTAPGGAVAGQQAAPAAAVAGLPSTSTAGASPLPAVAVIAPLAALLWRRIRR